MPTLEEIKSLLAWVGFWVNIQSEHNQILLSVLPRLRPIYTNQLYAFQRKFADLVNRIENIELRLSPTPKEQEQFLARTAIFVQETQQLNNEFMDFLNELVTVYPETDIALFLNHMRTESRYLGNILLILEMTLPAQKQPVPSRNVQSFLEELVFWARNQREHSQLLRFILPGLTTTDRDTLARFERDWRALKLSARRLMETLAIPGQAPELTNTEARRLALMARNLALEYIRFQEELLSRYGDSNSRFILRHMLKETRRFTEDLRSCGFLVF